LHAAKAGSSSRSTARRIGTDEEVISDAARTATLKQLGYHVYRVTNDDIEHNLPGVIDSIFNEVERQR
jgi:very-short-patch-repair endonuclease